jgi:eukaryotic-like serine/threonine-protein kinase
MLGSPRDQLLDRLEISLSDRYRIERELGAGGMATVYLAEDLKHHRNVAIKVLHAELSAILGPERFLKEIELTANLQHPHILPLFDSGSADGLLYYVMPYVAGETLRGRLSRERQLPVVDSVRIASEVADALDYAHKRGVIHRDIKPENILLHDGRALVADFGIALAVQQAGGERMTQTGLSLGTPQYMSPEQAMGERSVDARTDIYSLGAVTYEMLAGEPPFTGPTAQAIVAKVVTEAPRALIPQRRSIPPNVNDAVLTALEKLPADRFATAAEFAKAISATNTQGKGDAYRRADPAVAPSVARVLQFGAAAIALAVAGFLLGSRVRGGGSPIAGFGHATKVTWDRGLEFQPAISPDGKYVAYAAGNTMATRIFVRQVTGGRAVQLTDDSAAVQTNPQWSSDGSRILFLASGGVFSAPSSGGPARPEMRAPVQGDVVSAAWTPDGQSIAYTVRDSVYVRNSAGQVRVLAHVREAALCQWSPDAQLIACASGNSEYSRLGYFLGNLSPSRIVVIRANDGANVTISDSTSVNQSPVWSHDGKWLYFISSRSGPQDIYAVRVSSNGKTGGDLVRLTTGLGAHSISMSADGTRFAYDLYTATANIRSLPFPPNGATAEAATAITSGTQVIESVLPTQDGKWVYYDSNVSGTSQLYRQRLSGGEPEQLTSDATDNFSPAPSPNGREVAFHSWRSGSRDLYVLPLDGGAVQHVTSTPLQEAKPMWSPDGNALTYTMFGVPGGVWVVRRRNGVWGEPVRRVPVAGYPIWSPDGHWIAYISSSFTGGSLMVIDPDSGAPRIVFDTAGSHGLHVEQPFWSDDARTLYFKSHDQNGNATFWSVPVTGGKPTLLTRFTDPMQGSYRPEWSVGSGRMYFMVDDRQSDVWVMQATPR